MDLKNINIIEKKMQSLIVKIGQHLDQDTRKLDDLEYLIKKIENYVEDIEVIKYSIEKGKGKINENDFKIFIIEINQFANGANNLL